MSITNNMTNFIVLWCLLITYYINWFLEIKQIKYNNFFYYFFYIKWYILCIVLATNVNLKTIIDKSVEAYKKGTFNDFLFLTVRKSHYVSRYVSYNIIKLFIFPYLSWIPFKCSFIIISTLELHLFVFKENNMYDEF